MDKPKILFRADGNTQIGLGHIYRCIALAEMLVEDFLCEFLLSHQSQFSNVIPSFISVSYIPQNIQLAQEPEWIKDHHFSSVSLIILDGYQFNSAYQKKLKSYNLKLIYIDDLAQEQMFADAVINHSPSAKISSYKKEAYTKLFLGAEYIILRQGFLKKAKGQTAAFSPISTALITLGGSDENNITLKILHALLPLYQIQKINIVIGAAYQQKVLLTETIERSKKNVNLFSNLSEAEMIALMENCDIAFTPCSTTCLEVFAINKPVFAGFSASNQLGLYTYLTKNNVIFDLKDLQKINASEITQTVKSNIENADEINKMLILQKQLIDGNSGLRIKTIVKDLI